MLRRGNGLTSKILARYQALHERAQSPEDKKYILAGLAEVADAGALALVGPYLSDPQVKPGGSVVHDENLAQCDEALPHQPPGKPPIGFGGKPKTMKCGNRRPNRFALLQQVLGTAACLGKWPVPIPEKRVARDCDYSR